MKQILTEPVVAQLVPQRHSHSYKGDYGHVVCIGGNTHYGGAIMLAAQAAQRMGAGLVSVLCDQNHHQALRSRMPEVMCYDWHDCEASQRIRQQATVIVVGCGLGRDHHAQQVLAQVCAEQTIPVVFDADALFWLATQPELQPQMPRIYTPHLGEWARFAHDETQHVSQQAQQLAPVVVLKSAATTIYTATHTYQIGNGTPAMASGGMGDCLAGSIAGWLAQCQQLEQAAIVGTWLHSEAAFRLARTRYSVTASEVVAQFPELLWELSVY